MTDERRRGNGEKSPSSVIDATLRHAAWLTRNTRVIEATRLVRQALSGHGIVPGPKARDNRVVEAPDSGTLSSTVPPLLGRRPRQPLGATIDLLQRSRTSGLGVFEPQPSHQRAPYGMPEGAAYLTRSYTGDAGTRDYRLYVPAAAAKRVRALVVMLHGCTQTPDDLAAGTGMNALAEEHGFVVAYPRQASSANQSGCWNWFNPEDQSRDLGEPSIIAGLTQGLVRDYDIDESRVFVAGLSAGGAMAAILSVTYPDLFRAVGIHSGLAYGAASDLVSAFAAMRGTAVASSAGPRKRPLSMAGSTTRTILFHGTADQTVHPSNAEHIFAAARSGLNGAAESVQRGRSAGGLAYTRKVVSDAQGRPQLEHWTVEGLGHAWSGGRPDGSYTDPLGPDASREMVRFFLAGEPSA